MSGNDFGRKGSITASIILGLIGMGLTIGALLTPSWQVRYEPYPCYLRLFYRLSILWWFLFIQVVNLREYNSIHEHGLWLDCTRHSRDGERPLLQRYTYLHRNFNCCIVYDIHSPLFPLPFRYATITEPLHCVYKFDYDKYSGTFDLEDDNSPVGEVNRHKFYGEIHSNWLSLSILVWKSTVSIEY